MCYEYYYNLQFIQWSTYPTQEKPRSQALNFSGYEANKESKGNRCTVLVASTYPRSPFPAHRCGVSESTVCSPLRRTTTLTGRWAAKIRTIVGNSHEERKHEERKRVIGDINQTNISTIVNSYNKVSGLCLGSKQGEEESPIERLHFAHTFFMLNQERYIFAS